MIGSQIIDNLTGRRSLFSEAIIKYDEANRLWFVAKNYYPRNGDIVVMRQDTGEIIEALLTK